MKRLPHKDLPDLGVMALAHRKRAEEYSLVPLPEFTREKAVRPSQVKRFMRIVSSKFKVDSVPMEEEIVCKVYKWVYSQILLDLYQEGAHDLQCFLASHNENSINSDLLRFAALAPTPHSLLEFPVFGCNPKYIAALYRVLYKQALALDALLSHRYSLYTQEIASEPQKGEMLTVLQELAESALSPTLQKLAFPTAEFVSPSNRLASREVECVKLTEYCSPKFPELATEAENIQCISKLEFESCELDLSNSVGDLSLSLDELGYNSEVNEFWKDQLREKPRPPTRTNPGENRKKHFIHLSEHRNSDQRTQTPQSYRNKQLLEKGLKALYRARELNKSTRENHCLQHPFHALKNYCRTKKASQVLHTKHKQQQNSATLTKVLKAWFFIIRPSARYVKKPKGRNPTELDRLLTKICRRKRSISTTFRQLRINKVM